MPGENTLHDIRWGQHYHGNGIDDFVWVLLISGEVPAAPFLNGYKDAVSESQPAMYFPSGGGTLKGLSQPGPTVWVRIYVKEHQYNTCLAVEQFGKLPKKKK